MNTERFAVSAIGQDNVLAFPANRISRLWDALVQPVKSRLIAKYGLGLFGLRLQHTLRTYEHRNFVEILSDLTLYPPLHQNLRFMISDEEFGDLPDAPTEHQLLLAFRLRDGTTIWDGNAQRPSITQVNLALRQLPEVIADVLLDVSLSNHYAVNRLLMHALNCGWSYGDYCREKVIFLESTPGAEYNTSFLPGAKYASFSFAARGAHRFGSDEHIEGFVSLWDGFALHLLGQLPRGVEQLTEDVVLYPRFKGQLSVKSVQQALSKLPRGVHHLLVQKKSTQFRKSPRFANAIDACLTRANIIGSGNRPFGLYLGSVVDPAITTLVEQGAFYLVRLYVGGA